MEKEYLHIINQLPPGTVVIFKEDSEYVDREDCQECVATDYMCLLWGSPEKCGKHTTDDEWNNASVVIAHEQRSN